MRAPIPGKAVVASFKDVEQFEAVVKGYVTDNQHWSAQTVTPHPLESLDALTAYRPSPIPRIIFWAFICGATGGYLMQVYAMAITYPLNVGGRPLHSWPAFIPITFELGVLTAAITGLVSWLIRLRPRLYLRELESAIITRGTQDRYVLMLVPIDPEMKAADLIAKEADLKQAGAEETEVRLWD
ncbi:MAG: hypothetical protein E1N59_235 [Puniceicoccaceae bacterium 5H]|nr:MAG: hypothetical protein E1N59_235 [Puniceicoccaceae bacterium 5H]